MLPYLDEISKKTEISPSFYGLDRRAVPNDNAFADMKNMTVDHYPAIASRTERSELPYDEVIEITEAKNGLVFVRNNKLYWNGTEIATLEEIYPKRFVSMGAYLIVLPDKIYINLANLNEVSPSIDQVEVGEIEATAVINDTIQFSLCDSNGNSLPNLVTGSVAPSNPAVNQYWLDVGDQDKLKLWQYTDAWKERICYLSISGADFSQFSKEDSVTISGLTGDLKHLNGTHVVLNDPATSNTMLIEGIIDTEYTSVFDYNSVSIKRAMPAMDFIIESNNRLWGCRYGLNNNNEFVNEIYASKLGDFKSWNYFPGTAADSYTVSLGTDGKFTGAINFNGTPLFFRADAMHRIYGNAPSNYQLQTLPCRGVQKGSERSLKIVNETLYYKSNNAVCAFDGSLPVEISDQLGTFQYYEGVAGAFGDKYYISMREEETHWGLYCYDTVKRLWVKEDNSHATSFASTTDNIYMKSDEKIYCLRGGEGASEGSVPWSLTTGNIGYYNDNTKYLSKLNIRADIPQNSSFKVEISYDTEDRWTRIYAHTSKMRKALSLPIKPRRCDHFRIRLSGEGKFTLFNITKTFEEGSDVCRR